MHTHKFLRITIPGLYISALILLVTLIGIHPPKENHFPEAASLPSGPEGGEAPRESITFLLGEDEGKDNPYYTRAAEFYLHNPAGKTEYFVDSCRTLTGVRNHLQKHAPADGRPWGRINLVVHGNPWLGMSCRVSPGSRRAGTQSLRVALEEGEFPPLPAGRIDGNTELVLQSCGLGQDAELLEAVAEAFRGAERPRVSSPEHFVFYASHSGVGAPTSQSLARERHIVLPGRLSRLPESVNLSEKFVQKYPHEIVDWEGALSRTQPQYAGQAYRTLFRVPVIWTVTYPTRASRPDLNDPEDQQDWLMEQPELARTLAKMRIGSENFEWKFEKVLHWIDTEHYEPAIKATGWCTVVCVLETLTDEQGELLADEREIRQFYASAN